MDGAHGLLQIFFSSWGSENFPAKRGKEEKRREEREGKEGTMI